MSLTGALRKWGRSVGAPSCNVIYARVTNRAAITARDGLSGGGEHRISVWRKVRTLSPLARHFEWAKLLCFSFTVEL